MRPLAIAVSALLLCLMLEETMGGARGGYGGAYYNRYSGYKDGNNRGGGGARGGYAGAYYNRYGGYKHGNNRGGGDARGGYAGAYYNRYKYGNNGYGYRNGYKNYYGNHYNNGYQYGYHYNSYPYKYSPPSRPAGPRCSSFQQCLPGYYFNTEGCVCVSQGIPSNPPAPPPPPPVPDQQGCTRSDSSCNSRQRLDQESCSCECIKYLLVVPGRPATPTAPEDSTGTRGTTRGTRRSRTRGTTKRTSRTGTRKSRDAEDLMLELEDEEEIIREAEGRFRRRKSSKSRSSKSRSSKSSKSHSGSSRSTGRVFTPGTRTPGVPFTTQLVSQCPVRTLANEATCTCL